MGCLSTMEKITNKPFVLGCVYDNPNNNAEAGRGAVYDINGISPTILTMSGGGNKPFVIIQVKKFLFKGEDKMSKQTTNYRIRRLTPTECYRLMGFEDKDVNAAREVGVSNSSLYKQAGNSIITDCVELLAEHLYKAQYDDTYICRDECDKCKTPFPKDWVNENFIQPQ